MNDVRIDTGTDARTLVGIILLGVLGLYALGFDQGLILSLVQGDIAFDLNMLHEAVHDARHAAGFPCH
jgi:cobalt transporter subunit CbtB